MDNRYSRQLLFKPIGKNGQQRLQQATVTIIGCGALGTVSAETLVRAGIGHLHLVDRDYVESTNLQRQQLFTEQHARDMVPKVIAAEQRLREIRTDVKLTTYLEHATGLLMENLASKSDLIIDATDNFETRLLINDAAYKHNIPWIHGACVGSSGVVFPFIPGESACFRCLLPAIPSRNETCDTVGIIAPAVQVTAALQCTEAIKWLTGNREMMLRKVHHFDLWNHAHLSTGLSRIKNEQCETCGKSPVYPSLSRNEQMKLAALCGRDTVQIIPDRKREINLDNAERAGKLVNAMIKRTPYFVEIRVWGYRFIVFADGRLLIHGLQDIQEGRKLYHQLFG